MPTRLVPERRFFSTDVPADGMLHSLGALQTRNEADPRPRGTR